MKTISELREELSAYSHSSWAGWMKYLFSKAERNPDDSVTIPSDSVERWYRQMETEYANLPEDEKKSDREEADKMLAIMYGRYDDRNI